MSTLESLNKLINGAEYLGFNPTSNSTKPPHISNGLFRLVTGETCETDEIHDWVLAEEKQGALSAEQLREKYACILEEGKDEDIENIKQLRYFMTKLYDHDSTVYNSKDFSAFNICCHWLIKGSMQAEANIGDFVYNILSYRIADKVSPAIELLKEALKVDTDDYSKILKPLLSLHAGDIIRYTNKTEIDSLYDSYWDSCKSVIRKGFDNLARNLIATKESNNSLTVQERMVNYTGFAVFFYLINASCAKFGTTMVPILAHGGDDKESINRASEQSFTMAKKSVEFFYIKTIHNYLQSFINDNKESCLSWIDSELNLVGEKNAEEIREVVKKYFETFFNEEDSALEALAHALQIVMYTFKYRSNSPSDFARVMGVRFGIVAPKGNRATIKKYMMDSFTLETLALSVLNEEQLNNGISFKDFGQLLLESYNILMGTDVENEFDILTNCNIAQSTPGDLRGDLALNARSIADMYISLGHAKRYADGVTIFKWRA